MISFRRNRPDAATIEVDQPTAPRPVQKARAARVVTASAGDEKTLPMSVLGKLRVLIVNDKLPMRRMLRALLARWGFTRIDEAADNATALRRLKQRRYGLIISDGDARPASGRVLLWQVRGDPMLQAIPFILLYLPRERLTAAVRGASSCLTRPFDARALKATVFKVLTARMDPEAAPA